MPETLVLMDVDKTIINEQYDLPVPREEFVAALARAQNAGITLGLNSDSALPTVLGWAKEWGINGPLLAEQSVLCLQDEGYRTIPMHAELGLFRDLRNAFVMELLRRETHDERFLTLVGDVNSIVDKMPTYGTQANGTQLLVAVNGLRQFSLSFFARARTSQGWARREDSDANGPVMRRAFDVLKEVAGRSQQFRDLWGKKDVDNNLRYGICIVHRKGVHKRTPVARLLEMRTYDQVYMIGDSYPADFLNDERVVQCAVGNASEKYKGRCQMIARQSMAAGVIELLGKIQNGM